MNRRHQGEESPRTRRFVFLLLDQFSLLPFSTALEALRIANRFNRREVYSWDLVSETGADAVCSNGTRLRVDGGLDEVGRDDTIVVCGGLDIAQASTRPVLGWLRREARRGVGIGGLCTGAWTLAKAGLLDGRKCTIHWENHDSFAEEFDEVELSKAVYVIDGSGTIAWRAFLETYKERPAPAEILAAVGAAQSSG